MLKINFWLGAGWVGAYLEDLYQHGWSPPLNTQKTANINGQPLRGFPDNDIPW